MKTKEQIIVQEEVLSSPRQLQPVEVARRQTGFVQTFGLDVRVAVLTVLVDMLAFSGSILSAGLLYPVEIGAAFVLAFITYRIQKSWYGDNHDSALIKALVIGLVTAIPVPISWIVVGPGGALGLAHLFRSHRS